VGDPGFEVEIEAVPAPVCAPAIEPKPVETEDTGSALHRAFMAGLKSEPEPIPDLPPPPEPQVQGGAIVCSPCRVAIHFTDGDVRRGTIRELRADDSKLVLQAGDENSATEIPVGSLKAMFVIAPKDAKPSGGVRPGRLIDVKFRDGRMLRGYSSDEGGGGAIFSMLPEPRQGNIEKVVVFRAAVNEVK
jgi:hypothetical protein